MPLADVLAEFRGAVAQCDSLIANAHQTDAAGTSILPAIDREQITVAAFLNMYIAWESFLEAAILEFMVGSSTITGANPNKYVSPRHSDAAREMIIGVMRFFDYAHHENVRKIVSIYFENGYPFEPHLGSMVSELAELRAIRNACAHVTSTTQRGLEALALRLFGAPRVGITVYQLLTAADPSSRAGNTVFVSYRDKLLTTAELIAMG